MRCDSRRYNEAAVGDDVVVVVVVTTGNGNGLEQQNQYWRRLREASSMPPDIPNVEHRLGEVSRIRTALRLGSLLRDGRRMIAMIVMIDGVRPPYCLFLVLVLFCLQ